MFLMEMVFLAYMNENLLLSNKNVFLDLLINPEKNVWNLKSEIMYNLIYDIERNYVIHVLYLSHFINLVNE